jgi:hypothetical protein
MTMPESALFIADTPLKPCPGPVEGACVELDGEPFYRITHYSLMPPFLMSLVSDSDHWFFISSNGALTAGRRDPDHALFPYYTDDRIHDSQDQTGSVTLLRVQRGGRIYLWEPFSQRMEGQYRGSRSLYKSTFGSKIIFEEVNDDLALVFSYAWTTSEEFGFIRRAAVTNKGGAPAQIDLLDGIQNIMPYGLTRRFQVEFSTLADGYRESELVAPTGLGLFRLSSIPTDKAEPSEALRVTTVWSEGLDAPRILLSPSSLDRFRRGGSVVEETNIRGRRGAYLVNARLDLSPAQRREWLLVADVSQDAADVRATLKRLMAGKSLTEEVEKDVTRGRTNLVRIVASADGIQLTADQLSTWRHFSNALFNSMRGGVPDSGYRISRDDLISFIRNANRSVAARQADFLESLPDTILHDALLAQALERHDPDLQRLTREYLPFTFSRRHGDPSRPWNTFTIDLKNDRGERILSYQGNWRDIFQNWEALALSFPGYIESMIFKFLDASTADGYNPYQITRDGFDWETIKAHDPWSHIGYWGDHQVIYLLKLLEESDRYHPRALQELLARPVFTYANVPYRIKPYEALLKNPRRTIDLDGALQGQIQKRVAATGADGKLLLDDAGVPRRANLAEKLLVLVLSKLSNYIPEAGIWMNTQRPEWNDANNALVGYGVSMVTLCYLRRFLAFCSTLFARVHDQELSISTEVAALFHRIESALREHAPLLRAQLSDRDRKSVLDVLGTAGSDFRQALYTNGLSGSLAAVKGKDIAAFCDLAQRHIEHSIRANRRPDGLYHSYNLMRVEGTDQIAIRRLDEMLEGQVAVLSSGALSAGESVSLLDALRASSLYRADQNSYILYPDRRPPRFLEKNNIPAEALADSKLLTELLKAGDRRVVVRDVQGGGHFNAAFRNGEALRQALTELRAGKYRGLVEKEEAHLLGLYEQVFDHQSFTGRSGTFYKYEGLGCIYWHMVSKLLLAVQEVLSRAVEDGEEADTIDRLKRHYGDIREGIGVHKSPELYGAIPTDPYSHTPGFAGAQQPGMTGQVKEDLITRLGELGVVVREGRLRFVPRMLTNAEFLHASRPFRYFDVEGRACTVEAAADSLAFTVCQVPVIVHRAGPVRIELVMTEGTTTAVHGLTLDAETSAALFERTGAVRRLDVYFDV